MPDEIRIDYSEVEAVFAGFGTVDSWHKQVTDKHMQNLGRRLVAMMKLSLSQHRYTGELEESVDYAYDPAHLVVEVGPTAKRGSYDAGLLLEKGTRPIPNAPFGPIAKWAAFRGLPAGAVWMKIKTQGVAPHPFLAAVMARPGTQQAIQAAARGIGMDFLATAIKKMPTSTGGIRNVVAQQMGFSSGV